MSQIGNAKLDDGRAICIEYEIESHGCPTNNWDEPGEAPILESISFAIRAASIIRSSIAVASMISWADRGPADLQLLSAFPFAKSMSINWRKTMADNWELGDLGECINDDWGDDIPASSPLPARGDKLMVSGVKKITFNFEDFIVLSFISIGPDYRYWAEHFRKINPKGEDRMIPRREAVPA